MVYRVCLISGDGIRGIIPATILKEMLSQSKKLGGKGDITDLCDYLVGISMGSVVGAGLVVPQNEGAKYNPNEVIDILTNKVQTIFEKPQCTESYLINAFNYLYSKDRFPSYVPYLIALAPVVVVGFPMMLGALIPMWAKGVILSGTYAIGAVIAYDIENIRLNPEKICKLQELVSPLYDRKGLDSVLEEKFGNYRLNNTLVPFTTFSFSISEGVIKSFSTFKALKAVSDNYHLKDVLGATSATPTYFKSKVMKRPWRSDDHEVDAGMYINFPISAAIDELRKHASDSLLERIEEEGISILSIGTRLHISENIYNEIGENQGLLGWSKVAIRTVMEGIEYASNLESTYWPNSSRIDVELENDIHMDTAEAIQSMQDSALFRAEEEDINNYVSCIMQNKNEACIIRDAVFLSNPIMIRTPSYIKKFKDIQRERTKMLKHDHMIHEGPTLNQILAAEAEARSASLRINGQSIKDIIAKAKAKIAKDDFAQDHITNSIVGESVDIDQEV